MALAVAPWGLYCCLNGSLAGLVPLTLSPPDLS
jgi:hypothetical protein